MDDGRQTAAAPKPITAKWLERAALHYLERYAASETHLRRVLVRKIDRRARAGDLDAEPFHPLADQTVRRLVALGLVDDRAFAEARLASLRRRGTSTRKAAAALAAKGVPRDLVDAALSAAPGDEAAAALRLAERRRLGPFRTERRAENRERDLAALARAGFSYDVARATVDGAGRPDPSE